VPPPIALRWNAEPAARCGRRGTDGLPAGEILAAALAPALPIDPEGNLILHR